jgi:hypothetical protein
VLHSGAKPAPPPRTAKPLSFSQQPVLMPKPELQPTTPTKPAEPVTPVKKPEKEVKKNDTPAKKPEKDSKKPAKSPRKPEKSLAKPKEPEPASYVCRVSCVACVVRRASCQLIHVLCSWGHQGGYDGAGGG